MYAAGKYACMFKVVSLSNILSIYILVLQQNRFGQDGEVRTVVFIDPASVLLFVYEHVRVCVYLSLRVLHVFACKCCY